MFKLFKPNNVIIPVKPCKIVVSYNNEKCYKCNSDDKLEYFPNDFSLAYCQRCSIDILLFNYMTEDDYKILITKKKSLYIKKDSMSNFINSSVI